MGFLLAVELSFPTPNNSHELAIAAIAVGLGYVIRAFSK
jgi:hypothetical protein